MKIAVIIATYFRKDGTSKKNLLNVFQMLENQTYKNFKLFVIGDNYIDKNQFQELCKNYKKEIFFYNSNIDFRNNFFKIEKNKWCNGGINARFIGIKQAIKENYNYYFHLDDDDEWSSTHIENAINYINDFPLVDFMITKSDYKNIILPREHLLINEKKYNNFEIKACNSVHSSWIINLNTLGHIFKNLYIIRLEKIKDIKDNKIEETLLNPFDSEILKYLKKLQLNKKINAICILEKTVKKDTDVNIPK